MSKHIGSNFDDFIKEERLTLKPIEYKFECVKNNDIEVVFRDIIGQHVTLIAIQRDELMMDEVYRKAPDNFLLEVKQIIDKEIKERGLNEAI